MFRYIFLSSAFSIALFGITLKSLLNYTFDPNKQYDMVKAKEIYFKNKCNICHGDQGEKKIAGFKIIKDMEASDIKAALVDYSLGSRNSTSAAQMTFYAKSLSRNDMDYIIAYLKGENFAKEADEESASKTKNGIFLK